MQHTNVELQNGKVYLVQNDRVIELPVVDGALYIVENDELTPLPMPDTGFGTITINIVNNKLKQHKVETLYTKSEILRKG